MKYGVLWSFIMCDVTVTMATAPVGGRGTGSRWRRGGLFSQLCTEH